MGLNEYNFTNTRGLDKLETKNKSHSKLTFGRCGELLTRLEVLNQQLDIASTTHESSNEVVFLLCTNCGQEHFASGCAEELLRGEVQVIIMNSNLRTA